jgi:hypothetical protein
MKRKINIVLLDDETVAFIVDTLMTKNSYHKTRLGAKKYRADIYPSFDRVQLKIDVTLKI